MSIVSDYFSFQNGYAFKSKDFVRNGKYAIIRIKELKDGGVKFFEDTARTNPEDSFNINKYIVKKGDVLFALTGDPVNKTNPLSWVGRVSYYNHDTPALLNQRVCKAIPKNKVSNEFLYYFFRQNEEFYNLASKATGSASQANISTKTIEQHIMEIPDEDIRKKIVFMLLNIDMKIDVNNRINDNLLEQAQTLYKSWFIDCAPFDGSKPSDWDCGTIDDLAKEIVCGKTPSTKVTEYYGSDIPFITIPDMHRNTYAVTTERCLSTLGANSQAKKMLPKNSICVSCIGTAGLVTLVASESQTNQQINSIIPKDDYSPFYIYLLMQTLSEVINKLGQSGSTIVNLNKAQFGKIQVTVPSVSSMKTFDNMVSPLFALILENQTENIHLSSLRETLLPKLMSGDIDVSDIQL